MSGGSRCNVMPAHADVMADFTTSSAAGALRALMASWSLDECREWLSADDDVGLQLQLEPHTAKLFPQSGSSREVRY
jgi:predicted flavoprotein YhiN